MSYQFSLLWIEHVVHLLKSQNGVLNAQEKRTFPANGSSHWGLILEDWRFVSIGFEQCIHGIHLMNGKIKLGLMFLLTILLKIKPRLNTESWQEFKRSWSHLASALDRHVVWIAQESVIRDFKLVLSFGLFYSQHAISWTLMCCQHVQHMNVPPCLIKTTIIIFLFTLVCSQYV